MAKKTTAPGKKKSPAKAEPARPATFKAEAKSAASRNQPARSRSKWEWEGLAGIIGEKCYRSDDFTHSEVGRWWYDIMASSQKYRWKTGATEKSAATSADAREAILAALANHD